MKASFNKSDPGYMADTHAYLVFYSKITCVVTIILVLMGIGLDAAFYPQHFLDFFYFRLLETLLLLLVLACFYTEFGNKYAKQLTYFWISTPQILICYMIGLTDAEQSIYFVALTFALSGIGLFLPIRVVEAVTIGVMTICLYLAACWLNPNGWADMTRLSGNVFFLLMYAMVCVFVSIYSEKWRMISYQLKRMEIQSHVIEQEKMAALGTLAAGLLHEVNNPVHYSLMAMEVALKDPITQTSELLVESLIDAKEGMMRVQAIVSDLKTFAYQRPDESAMQLFLLESAVISAKRLVSHELKEIGFSVELPQGTRVWAEQPAIIGVLVNLFSNAAIALKKAQRAQPKIEVRGEKSADRMHLYVRDNGTGIEAQDLSRIFEPFFTTREVGQGLGLGPSVSYSIIQRHGGTLKASSKWGEWTEFVFDLQAASSG